MIVWIIQRAEILPIKNNFPKMRTAILVDKLIDKNHSVLWWTSAFDHFKKNWRFRKDTELEVNKLLKIKILKGIGYKKNISFSRYIDHRIISWKFRRLAPKMPKPDIIIASMPSHDLAYEAVEFAKKNNIPSFVDIRDPWPDIFLKHIPLKLQKIAKIFLYKDFQMVKKTMRMADGLIGASKTFLEWGLKYADREKTWKDRVFYLGYKRQLNLNIRSNKIHKLRDTLIHKFIVTFIGTFASYHNPSILVDCAVNLKNKNIYFILAGDGELFNAIKKRTSYLSNVILVGWLNQEEITTLLQYSHVGVCPTTQKIDLFPNKAFSYLSSGLPIISAFCGDLKEIIRKYHIGFNYPANDIDRLVSCIKKLYDSPKLYRFMSENVRGIFDNMFDADKIYEEYSNHIENVVKISMDKG